MSILDFSSEYRSFINEGKAPTRRKLNPSALFKLKEHKRAVPAAKTPKIT